MKNSIDN